MNGWRRVRGLAGAALTWGTVGALSGALLFVGRYRPWPVRAIHWDRFWWLFGAFTGTGALWGAVCGVAFGVVLWRLGRRWSLPELSTRRVTWWGAVAGAAFPVLVYTPAVLVRGIYGTIPLFATIVMISAVVGAGCARTLLALARRAPNPPDEMMRLGASSPDRLDATSFAITDREKVR